MNRFLLFSSSVALSALVCFSSCARLFTGNSTTRLEPQTEEVKVEVYSSQGVNVDIHPKKVADNTYKLGNRKKLYFVRQSREGFKTQVTPVYRSKFNKLKLIDLGLPLILGLYWGNEIQKSYDEDPAYEAFNGYGTAMTAVSPLWVSLLFGPWKIYEKFYELPPLTPLPKRTADERFLIVNKSEMNVNKDDYRRSQFRNYEAYEAGNRLYGEEPEEELKFESDFISAELNNLLHSYGYIDSANTLFVNTYKSLGVECEIQQIGENYIGMMGSSLSLITNWRLMDMSTEEVVTEQTISSDSYAAEIMAFYDEEKAKGLLIDALENSLIKFLESEQVEKALQDTAPAFVKQLESWEKLEIRQKNVHPASISDAAQSVVTIDTESGHGSGCIISEQGYIVTNHHVINKAEKLEVILNDGRKLQGSLIRSNPLLDLALIKVEATLEVKPFGMGSIEEAQLGSETYAVGTPSKLDLGQTISKGIISGKRNIENHTYLQTDVSINAGSSGGALINKEGKLLGIINNKLVGVGVEGIGFAIPVSYLEEALKIQLIER